MHDCRRLNSNALLRLLRAAHAVNSEDAHSRALRATKTVRHAASVSGKPTASPTGGRYLFHEYFHADNGAGLGASHQTGWTGLVAKLIQQQGEFGTIQR
jgi:hypothetical protein